MCAHPVVPVFCDLKLPLSYRFTCDFDSLSLPPPPLTLHFTSYLYELAHLPTSPFQLSSLLETAQNTHSFFDHDLSSCAFSCCSSILCKKFHLFPTLPSRRLQCHLTFHFSPNTIILSLFSQLVSIPIQQRHTV